MERKALTEDQMQVLAFAPAEASDDSLARKIGAPVATVHNARWRIKRYGWTCRVSYGICNVCGEPMTRRGFRAAHQRYHPDCRMTALRAMAPIHHQARMKRTSETARNELIDRLHEYEVEGQRETRAAAVNHLKRWSHEEDAVVLDPKKSALEVATELGRSLRAVKRRKHYLVHGD